jgi:hypothetical protein
MNSKFVWRLLIYFAYTGLAAVASLEWALFYRYREAHFLGLGIFMSLIVVYMLINEVKSE